MSNPNNIELGPYGSFEEMVFDLKEYEYLRRSGNMNMYELSMFWDKRNLKHIMGLYTSGVADSLLANA